MWDFFQLKTPLFIMTNLMIFILFDISLISLILIIVQISNKFLYQFNVPVHEVWLFTHKTRVRYITSWMDTHSENTGQRPLCACRRDEQIAEHALQYCTLLEDQRNLLRPSPTNIRIKLHGSLKKLRRTSKYICLYPVPGIHWEEVKRFRQFSN